MRSLKPKACKICGVAYIPFNSFAKACSPECAIEFVRREGKKEIKKKEKEFNKETRARKKALKSKGDWLREAQAEFNKYIRGRDAGKNCISCQKPPRKKNAGHYLSRGAYPELRFEELNCHLQCEHCNTYLSANLVNYRVNLIEKIGIDKVEWLEGPHSPKKYTIDDIKAIKAEYQKKFKELKNEQA